VEKIKSLPFVTNCDTMHYVCSEETLNASLNMIDREFTGLLSTERKALIKMCLKYRHARIKKILTFAL